MVERLPEWAADMVRCVDDKLMQQISDDFRRGPPPAGPTLPTVTPVGAGVAVSGTDKVASGGSGWVDAPSTSSWRPPGLREMDAMMDQQDVIDRAQRIREVAEVAAVQRALTEAERKEKESQT